uniref:Uncharacterized protein n=1 Tax=Oryza sativa subsp. japonica TaxID=39947 RepID=Q67U68_ORYSJ|nr:hypothetical protein [Oryza sativa Japonica Group]
MGRCGARRRCKMAWGGAGSRQRGGAAACDASFQRLPPTGSGLHEVGVCGSDSRLYRPPLSSACLIRP